MLRNYLQRLYEVAKRGDAREESYYSCLETLLKTFLESKRKRAAHITTLPKKTEAGNPDFRLWDGKQHIIGYIEAKKPTDERLDLVEDSEQLSRYRHTFPNLILTNFFEFRLYRNGERVNSVLIARPFIVHKLKTIPPVEKEQEFFNLLEQFFAFSLPRTYTAKTLAVELAKRTRFLRDQVIAEELKGESNGGADSIHGFYEAFQKYLIGSLTKEQFADLYAQTITYGLFVARTRSENGFTRRQAFDNIPHTIGILRDVFRFISLGDLPQQMEWIVDDIADVLATADVNKILRERAGRDPIVHFYEPFLAEYDPEERERRGVYYTPEPVVSYIVRSLNRILKEVFNRPDGFASTSVRVLDPAAGTCTFPAEAARLALTEFGEKYGAGARKGLIRDHVLKNFYAFELMMAPYAVGHLKIGFLLEELGYRLSGDDRFPLYLTNTLELEELEQSKLPGMSSLAEESHLAGRVKKEIPILVILGNPPYSGHSANVPWKFLEVQKGKRTVRRRVFTFIGRLIEDYKKVDGKPLGEKNPKWLQDDYVKFIRFAQWKIEQAGEGVLGFITNHSYLDNPTFRGMRQSLMKSFEQIYLLDLHGNTLKKEKSPDGSEDKNVFDIRQGVTIALFVKKPGLKRRICHADRWGPREDKYTWLEANDIQATGWRELHPNSPLYLFVPRDEGLLGRYQRYPKVTEIFPINSVGIVTSRDHFVIDFHRESLKQRIRLFQDEKMPDDLIRQSFSLKDKANWKLSKKRKAIRADENWEEKVTEILYRPFDTRQIFYHHEVIERSRSEVMRHMLRKNLALCVGRAGQVVGLEQAWNVVFCSERVEDFNLFYRGGNVNLPLYLYPDVNQNDLLGSLPKSTEKKPNLADSLRRALKKVFNCNVEAEAMFFYTYAILYSPNYRTTYAEFLKTDFPRIPFTKVLEVFEQMGQLGQRLVDLHLLRSPELDSPVARFQGVGENKVEKPHYSEEKRRVYINDAQYFEGVEPAVWEYQVGGYQVCEKWLKDRKGRFLSLEDVRHYCRMVTALAMTIETQTEIDRLYPDVEQEVLVFRRQGDGVL